MPEFQLLPGARGLDFPDGRSIKADRRGRVKVYDDTAREIRGSAAFRRYDSMVDVASYRGHSDPDDVACACGFVPWAWTRTCPKCGSSLRS
jgi:hypothetical protein